MSQLCFLTRNRSQRRLKVDDWIWSFLSQGQVWNCKQGIWIIATTARNSPNGLQWAFAPIIDINQYQRHQLKGGLTALFWNNLKIICIDSFKIPCIGYHYHDERRIKEQQPETMDCVNLYMTDVSEKVEFVHADRQKKLLRYARRYCFNDILHL